MIDQEKRKFIRVSCQNLIAYCVLQEGGRMDVNRADFVQCKNISEAGVLFTALDKFLKETILKLKLRVDLEGGRSDEITMIGEVVRCDEIDSSGKWDVGVFIASIEKLKRETFFSWLEKKLEKQS